MGNYRSADSYSELSYGFQAVGNIAGAYEQATALRAQGDFQLTMAKINQQFSDLQAKSVIDQGNSQANQLRRKGEQTVGAQRAAAAAQGIDVNDSQGTIGSLAEDTRLAEAQDIATARSNAWKAAWGIKTQAAISVSNAKFNKSGNDFAAESTLLTGGLNAAGNISKAAGIAARGSSYDPDNLLAPGMKKLSPVSPGDEYGTAPSWSRPYTYNTGSDN